MLSPDPPTHIGQERLRDIWVLAYVLFGDVFTRQKSIQERLDKHVSFVS